MFSKLIIKLNLKKAMHFKIPHNLLYFFILFFPFAQSEAQKQKLNIPNQVPIIQPWDHPSPNLETKEGRQGGWIIWYDIYGKELKVDKIHYSQDWYYYRKSKYQDGLEVGQIEEFYNNGIKKYSCQKILIKEGTELTKHKSVKNGTELHYTVGGNKVEEAEYNNGKFIRATIYNEDGSINLVKTSWSNGVLHKSYNEYNLAVPHFVRAIELYKLEFGANNGLVPLLEALGDSHIETGHIEQGAQVYSAILPIYKSLKEIDYKTEIRVLTHRLIEWYTLVGDWGKMEKLLIESIKDLRAEGIDEMQYVERLGRLYLQMGLREKGISLLKSFIEDTNKKYNESDPLYPSMLFAQGVATLNIGVYEEAETLLLKAEKIFSLSTYQVGNRINCIEILAFLYIRMGRYQDAEQWLSEILKVIKVMDKESFSEDPDVYRGSILTKQAFALLMMKQKEKVESLLIELDLIVNAKMKENNDPQSVFLSSILELYLQMKQYEKAKPILLHLIQLAEHQLGVNSPINLSLTSRLALVYINDDRYQEAGKLYSGLIRNTLDYIAENFPYLSEKEKQDFYKSTSFYFADFQRFCIEQYPQNLTLLEEMFNLGMNTKGLLLNASNNIRDRILSGTDEDLKAKFNLWQLKRDSLAKYFKMPSLEKERRRKDEIRLKEEANTLEKSISFMSEVFATEVDRRKFTWQDVQQKLKPGEVAVEIVRVKPKDEEKSTTYVALIVSQQTKFQPDIVLLKNGHYLEDKHFNFYRNAIKQKLKDELSYDLYWKPIADKISGSTRVYISADGVFNQINLNTLFNTIINVIYICG
jgi:Tetratricopeptide repeat